jgi:plastocyanin
VGGTPAANWNLLAQALMMAALTLGWILARGKKFGPHHRLQTSVVLFNLVMIFTVMLPSLRREVLTQALPAFKDPYYALAALHALVGTIAAALGVYVILSAGTKLLPKSIEIQNWRLWMRRTLACWALAFALGLGVYFVWYGPASKAAVAAQNAAPVTPVTVSVSNFQFEPKGVTVPVGGTVEWVDQRGRHNVTADDGSFKSPELVAGDKFDQKFDKAGVYKYYCTHHGHPGGQDMAGTVTVK